jgi:hypothetical protein
MSQDLELFRKRVEEAVHRHPVVVDNAYTRWFATGEATAEEVRHLAVQFSVFSHQFVEAQLRKVINAADLESYRAGKEILMNELGVVYRPPGGRRPGGQEPHDDVDPEIVGTEGSVDASTFRFSAAHFEWLLSFGEPLGLGFADMGKRRHATPSTLFFCDELLRIYGSPDPSVGEGASFAVEHWAAAGFWKELIAGLRVFRERECPMLPLGFWTWHDKIEDQHAAHTSDELEQAFFSPGFDEDRFLQGAREMLDGVKVFWDGLWRDHVAGRAA